MRLTPETIRRAQPYLNPLGQRELGFRTMNIAIIENLGVLDDIYESMDFTTNDIVKFEGFPVFNRLDTLLLSNNQISKIDKNIADSLPNLTTLNLHNNKISNFLDIIPLRNLTHLTTLILTNNPLIEKYMNWKVVLIVLIPQLIYINFQSVSDELRDEAKIFKKKLKKGASLESMLIIDTNYLQQQQQQQQQYQQQQQQQQQQYKQFQVQEEQPTTTSTTLPTPTPNAVMSDE